MCGMVESLNVSASAAILIYTLSERMRLTVGNWRMSDAEQAETLCPLDAAQREGFRSDFATPGYGPGFIGGFGAPGPNPRKWIK